jgi:hypothetical protein
MSVGVERNFDEGGSSQRTVAFPFFAVEATRTGPW